MANEHQDWNERYRTGEAPWDSGVPSRELERILAERAIAPCRTLELGCGTGTNAIYLAKRGFEVVGTDLSPLAIEKAKEKAAAAKVSVRFLVADIARPVDLGPTFAFVFDRGVYHVLRKVNLEAFRATLVRHTEPGSLYLTLAGNAYDEAPEDQGPPRVRAGEITTELEPEFQLIQLREFHFHGVVVEGRPVAPLAWSALFRRR